MRCRLNRLCILIMVHEHDHSTHCSCKVDEDLGVQYSLYNQIVLDQLVCLNETIEDSGKSVFRAWNQRLDSRSDLDAELLFNIPFKNRPYMTMADCSVKPDQEVSLAIDNEGIIQYPIKAVTFSSVQHLSMYFPTNYGDLKTVIYYIGLKGECAPVHRHGVTICSYETTPNVTDHKNVLFDVKTHQVS